MNGPTTTVLTGSGSGPVGSQNQPAEIEDEIWAWVVRGEDDAGAFVDYFSAARERHGVVAVQSNLTLAFAELNQLGVLARENFTCCGTCAAAEIHDERDNSRHWHGYLWYNQQDTESLICSPDGSAYLGYGAYPPEEFDQAAYDGLPDSEKQARQQADVECLLDGFAFPVFRKHGMRVEWNRNLATRILLTGARWYAPLA